MDNKYQKNFQNAPSIYLELPVIKTDKIEKWLRNKVFNATGYIFYDRKKDEAICSVCGKSFNVPEDAEHKKTGKCHKCNSDIIFRSAGYCRESLTQRARMVLFQSKGKSIYVTINMIYLEFKEGYGQLYKDCEAVYKFNRTVQEGWKTSCWWGSSYWDKMKNIHIPVRQGEWAEAPLVIYDENINKVFKKTDLKYCQLENQINEWDIYDLIRIVTLNAKYQSIEKLYKVGLTRIIADKMNRRAGTKYIKWNKGNIKEILGLNRDEIKQIKELNYGMTDIALYKILKAEEINIKLEDISKWNFSDVYKVRGIHVGTFKSKWKYLNRQLKYIRSLERYKYYYFYNLINDYKDYIKECQTLEFDLTDNMIIYPKNLIEAHSRTSSQVKIKASEIQNALIEKIANKNEKLNYCYSNYIITVASSALEIIREGKELGHCVGGYIQEVIDNKSLILFVRKASDPDVPYYTLELLNQKINQCRGYRNCNMTDDVKAFVDKWHSEVVMNSNKKTKSKKTVKKEKIKVA